MTINLGAFVSGTVLPFYYCPMTLIDSINIDLFILIAYSAFNDVLLSLLPWKVIWPLHLSRRERVGVCVAMSMGIL